MNESLTKFFSVSSFFTNESEINSFSYKANIKESDSKIFSYKVRINELLNIFSSLANFKINKSESILVSYPNFLTYESDKYSLDMFVIRINQKLSYHL